jgi:uncharacterized iron-regulated protein
MKIKIWNAFILVFIFWMIGCTPMIKKSVDPLIGKIYESSKQQEVSYQMLFKKMLDARVIYLGENHENADHHAIQLRILKDLIQAGKKPLIGFEFFSIDQTAHLMSFVQIKPHNTDPQSIVIKEKDLREKLGWHAHGDQAWQYYYQLIELALKNKLTIFGADLPKCIVKRIVRVGAENLTGIENNLLQPTFFDDMPYQQLMYSKFKAVHCGFSTPKMSERMYQAWIARNDTMAYSIVSMLPDDENRPLVMILGAGHVQHNMAVYDRVAFYKPDLNQINLGLQEIATKPSDAKSYMANTVVEDKTFLPSHEYFWFTDRNSYEDPCEKFKGMLQGMTKPTGMGGG